MFAIIKWLCLLLIALTLAGFSVVNRHFITLAFYPLPFEVELPVYLLILVVFFSGFTAAWLMDRLKMMRAAYRYRRTAHRTAALEEEVARLKHQPITD